MDPVLRIRDLEVGIPVRGGVLRPVRGVSLSVMAGETLCIVGESGCGKTLTALSIPRLLPRGVQVSRGRIELTGVNLLDLGEREMEDVRGRDIGVIFQDPMTSLNPSMRVGLQVDEAIIRHLVLGRRKACELALSLLQKVGIADPEQVHACYPHQLSGGLRQRVMIAMALACRPRLIIADEPTTALDATTQLKVLTLLRDLQREMGTALVFITHDLGVVGRIADRVVVMYAGEIVEDGSRDQVLSAPSHPYTSALMRCIPHPGVTPPRSRLGALPGTVAPATTGRAGCGFLGRCAAAEPRCSESPAIRDVERGHRVRCHLGVPWRSDTARQKIAG